VVDTVEIPLLDEARVAQVQARAGRIGFDERGNAIYQWQKSSLAADGEDADQLRAEALDHPGLAIVDDAPPAHAPIQRNAAGARIGYNPYESGPLDRKLARKPSDMRKLSKWIELKRKLADGGE
jgi:hypothetical protein